MGRVADRETGLPVHGASIVLALVTGGCSGILCPFGNTSATGAFSIMGSPGTYTMTITASNYTTNDSQVTLSAGQTTSLGTIYLLEDSYVTGLVLGNDPTHEPIAGVGVIGTSRNSVLTGQQGMSDKNGSFRAQVPAGADRIDLGPPAFSPYESNHTFIDPKPGQTVSLGTLYLVRGTRLTIELIDRVTHRPIGPAFGSEEIACDAQTGDCPLPDTITSGPNVTVYAIPGPTQLHAVVEGYVVNVTPIGVVPVRPEAAAVAIEVNVTPLGVIGLTPGVTGGVPLSGGNSTNYWEWWFGVTSPNDSNVTGLDLCSLEGVTVGVPIIFAPGYQPDICFPEVIARFGGAMFAVGPPLRDWVELGSFQGAAPMFQNETWVNLTPDRLTTVGYLNFTPGAYVYGQVYTAGTTHGPGSFTVQACSTDETSVCGPVSRFPWSPSPSQRDIDSANASLVGCPTGSADFCVAAPPGPVAITVAGGNFTENLTWAEIPLACCSLHPHALPLPSVTSDHVHSINVSAAVGSVYGKVMAGPGAFEPPIDSVTIEICPVAPGSPPCSPGYSQNDNFSLPAPLGWDDVAVQATGYLPNSTWIDVNGTDPAGTIVLTPLATIAGRVVDPNGTGIAGAVLQDCPLAIASPPQPGCQTLPTPQVGSSGYFVGALPGGPFPGSTYGLTVSASGYLSNFTWLNATPGELLDLPPIVLTPVGNGSANGPLPPAMVRPSGTPGTWVVGRLLDGRNGFGVPGASLTACTFSSSVCVTFNDLTGSGGQFNESVPLGTYHLFADQGGYAPGEYFLNATGTATVDLGALTLDPYPFVAGRVAISPWQSYSKNAGFGPGPASIQVCNSVRTSCGLSTELNTAGAFNITAPPGSNDALTVNGTGGSPFDGITAQAAQGGGAGGFVSNLTPVTVNRSDVQLSQSPGLVPVLGLFTVEQGVVLDGSSPRDRSGVPTEPARWATVSTSGPDPGSRIQLYVGGGGNYTVLVPPLENVRLVGGGGAFLLANVTATIPASAGSSGVPASGGAGALVLPHYGWIVGRIRSNASAPVPFASITVARSDRGNNTTLSVSGWADGDGYYNESAPPGPLDNVTVSASGFVTQRASASVLPSATTPLVPFQLLPTYTVEYVRSIEVNDVGVLPTVTLVDPVSHQAVDRASLELLDRSSGLDGITVSNGLGQFLLGGMAGSVATLSVFRSGFETEAMALPNPIRGAVVYPRLNVTGDGVLAGRVVASPRSTPTPGVNVTACEVFPSGGCETVTSNGAGLVWFEVPPGAYRINLSAEGYTVDTTYGGQSTSDVWAWLGNLTVAPDGVVSGHVVGDPFGVSLDGANVTWCPTNGTFSIDCAFSTPTDPTGGFAIRSPPGTYFLNVSASGYGRFSLEVELSPGQRLDLGDIPLSPDGAIVGTVVNAETGTPIASASVSVCPSDGGPCEGPASTSVAGTYLIDGIDPGDATLTASANGYSPSYRTEVVPVGGTLVAKPVGLFPIGVLPEYGVSGAVVWNGTGTPIAGATVSATYVGGGFGQATVTRPNGTFALSLIAGSYRLTTSAPGALLTSTGLVVGNTSRAGLLILLNRTTYPVTGWVRSQGSGAPLGGVWVSAGSAGSTTTGLGGAFRLALPNGSYSLSARPLAGPIALEYSPITLSLSVNGAGEVVNVTLPRASQALEILVVDAETGLGVGGAVGTVTGRTTYGSEQSTPVAADGGGTISVSLPSGNYTVRLNATGFSSASSAFSVNGSTPPVLVSMVPLGAGRSPAGGLTGPEVEWAIAAAIGAAAIVLYAVGRRPGPQVPPEERAGTDRPIEPGPRRSIGSDEPEPPGGSLPSE